MKKACVDCNTNWLRFQNSTLLHH